MEISLLFGREWAIMKITIIGPTGCGKSTVANLIYRTLEEKGFTVKLSNGCSPEDVNDRTAQKVRLRSIAKREPIEISVSKK